MCEFTVNFNLDLAPFLWKFACQTVYLLSSLIGFESRVIHKLDIVFGSVIGGLPDRLLFIIELVQKRMTESLFSLADVLCN